MNKGLDKVPAEETSRMRREGRDPILKKSRWLLLKRSENLKEEQHFRLRDLLRYNLKTVRAYLFKEAFQPLGLQLTGLGRQIPRRMVPPNHAIPHRTHEENRALPTHASR